MNRPLIVGGLKTTSDNERNVGIPSPISGKGFTCRMPYSIPCARDFHRSSVWPIEAKEKYRIIPKKTKNTRFNRLFIDDIEFFFRGGIRLQIVIINKRQDMLSIPIQNSISLMRISSP